MLFPFYLITFTIIVLIVSIITAIEDFNNFGITTGSSISGKVFNTFFRDVNPFQITIVTDVYIFFNYRNNFNQF